jgi:DNA-directed RNA polymerase beta subunit
MTDDPDIPPPPNGVRLRDPEDSDTLRKDMEDGVLNSMQRYVHGYEYGGVRLELDNLHYADKEKYSLAEQKEALMSDRLLSRRLRGNVKLVDAATNKVIDQKKNFTLARMPYLTQRGTLINNGSEFALISQSRLLPGAYTRRRDNGELETHFNVRPGTGSAMRVSLDPVTAQYRLKIGTSDLHAYSVFKDLGVSDDELARRWGPKILEVNRSKYSKDAVDRAYLKAVPKWQRDPQLPREEKAKAILDAFNRAQVAEGVLKANLPNLYSREKAAFWRQAGRATEVADEMAKSASVRFAPDLSPDEMVDAWQELDFDLLAAEKSASFDPDLSPEDMREAYNSIYGKHGPRLASMRQWPSHWLDDQDSMGWLEWYRNYASGRRSDSDERQIKRWKSFKSRHGAQFVNNPTPRRAYALKHWAIDPLKMLPDESRDDFEKEMDAYRRKEFMRWYMQRHDFDDDAAAKLGAVAKSRGASFDGEKPDAGQLMTMALEGHLTPEDLS